MNQIKKVLKDSIFGYTVYPRFRFEEITKNARNIFIYIRRIRRRLKKFKSTGILKLDKPWKFKINIRNILII